MFKKVLIANRGEVAIRIIRACRDLNLKTVAIYSEADKEALHVKLADEAVCIGPPQSGHSYLNINNIISAANITGADAIHPGYGFLSENPYFAELCAGAGVTFIGPSPQVMRLMGSKAKARETMQAAGVPVVPGSPGVLKDPGEALSFAAEVGYPVIVKASAGGGGRGMRVAQNDEDLKQALQIAQNEAAAAFGDSQVYLEKYIEEPRHIEVQIVADQQGNIVHLGERDCSLQRRHQKILEEAPAYRIDPETRAEMGKTAVIAAQAVGYHSLGTVEFLLDRDNNFYFMEMNTRLQVEHPVTEMVTGIDLVKEQIRIAAGYPLSFSQDDVVIRGCAIECRINAEDPQKGFRPSPGRITDFLAPGGFGVRFDSALYPGYTIPPYYDSLIGKLVVWGEDRTEAIGRMRRALSELVVKGVETTVPFHLTVLDNAFYRKGEVYTNFIQRRILKG
jgi:acetyl-CoA carboxylase biotin carboxylase subunit